MSSTPALPDQPPAFDFMASLTVLGQDPAYVRKLLIGSLVLLAGMLLLPLPLLIGYYFRVLRRTALGDPRPLPEWDDWGGLFLDGLRVLALVLPHQLGFLLSVGIPFGVVMLSAGALGDQGGALFMLLILPLLLLAVVAALGFAAYVQVAQMRLAVTQDLAAAFEPGANVAFLRRNIGSLLMAFAVLLATNFVAQFGVLLCCVGVLPATLWSQIAFHHALGQVARLDAAEATTAG
jgi:Protein of unknown function (DUF4013)